MGGGWGGEDGGRGYSSSLSSPALCCIFRLVLVRDVYIENNDRGDTILQIYTPSLFYGIIRDPPVPFHNCCVRKCS